MVRMRGLRILPGRSQGVYCYESRAGAVGRIAWCTRDAGEFSTESDPPHRCSPLAQSGISLSSLSLPPPACAHYCAPIACVSGVLLPAAHGRRLPRACTSTIPDTKYPLSYSWPPPDPSASLGSAYWLFRPTGRHRSHSASRATIPCPPVLDVTLAPPNTHIELFHASYRSDRALITSPPTEPSHCTTLSTLYRPSSTPPSDLQLNAKQRDVEDT